MSQMTTANAPGIQRGRNHRVYHHVSYISFSLAKKSDYKCATIIISGMGGRNDSTNVIAPVLSVKKSLMGKWSFTVSEHSPEKNMY